MQYIQIKEMILEQIDGGTLLPRQKLPSERVLALSFNTTRITLREALSLLETEGRIYREDRRGWFISPLPLRYCLQESFDFTQMALSQERLPKTECLGAKCVLADQRVLALLGLAPFSTVHCIERLYYLEGRVVAYGVHYIRADCFPHLLKQDGEATFEKNCLDHVSPFYKKTHYQISARALFGLMASRLRATSGTLGLRVERIHSNQEGKRLDVEIEHWRQDAIHLEFHLSLE